MKKISLAIMIILLGLAVYNSWAVGEEELAKLDAIKAKMCEKYNAFPPELVKVYVIDEMSRRVELYKSEMAIKARECDPSFEYNQNKDNILPLLNSKIASVRADKDSLMDDILFSK